MTPHTLSLKGFKMLAALFISSSLGYGDTCSNSTSRMRRESPHPHPPCFDGGPSFRNRWHPQLFYDGEGYISCRESRRRSRSFFTLERCFGSEVLFCTSLEELKDLNYLNRLFLSFIHIFPGHVFRAAGLRTCQLIASVFSLFNNNICLPLKSEPALSTHRHDEASGFPVMSYEISLSKYPFSADNQAWSFYHGNHVNHESNSIRKACWCSHSFPQWSWICGGAMAPRES